MLKLTKTGIGLLTKQYRSVLKKCWLINLGIFAFLYSKGVEAYTWGDLVAYTGDYKTNELMFQHTGSIADYGWQGQYFDFEKWALGVMNGAFDSNTTYSAGTGLSLSGTTFYIANGAVTDAKIASGITASKITQNASYRFVSDTEKATWNGYSTTIAGKADSATTLSGYGITDAYTKTEVDDLISGSGSSYSAGTGISLANKVISLDSNYLDNNYYRKNEKSGILNGFEAGKIGNENDDNFSKFRADNDNFATKNGGFVLNNDNFALNNDSFLTNNGDFASKNLSRLEAFSKCEKACSRPSERFPASLEKNSAFEQYSRSARGTFLFVSQTHKNVLDSFYRKNQCLKASNDNFATTTFLRAI